MNFTAIVAALQAAVPGLSAVYAFGSQVSGDAGPDSDLDLALTCDEPLGPQALWDLSAELEGVAGCPVDLLDFRAASTVMQYRILITGRRLWARDGQAALYESFVLSEKTALDEARGPLLRDIQRTGVIYGR